MKKQYCNLHGEYSEDFFQGGCPECRRAQKQEERDRDEAREKVEEQAEELERARERDREEAKEREEAREQEAMEREEREAELVREQIFRSNNPGDFECPECKMISLKRNAKRCPKCHGVVESSYWNDINKREAEIARKKAQAEEERLAKERAAAEWLKSPEGLAHKAKVAAAKAAAEAAAEAAADAARNSENARKWANIALGLSVAGLFCDPFFVYLPLRAIGAGFGILALYCFKRGQDRKGRYKAIIAVVFGFLWIIFTLLMYFNMFGLGKHISVR